MKRPPRPLMNQAPRWTLTARAVVFNSLGADGREAGDAPRQGPHLPGNRVERPLFLFWSWILRLKN